jgi:hypothetical protein
VAQPVVGSRFKIAVPFVQTGMIKAIGGQVTPVEPPTPVAPLPPVPGLTQAIIVQAICPLELQLQVLQPSDDLKLLPAK